MTTSASITGGTIVGAVVLVALLVACAAWFLVAALHKDFDSLYIGRPGPHKIGAVLVGLVVVGFWWWGMAFTLSGDYHAWNVKQGAVEKVSKRLIATDSGMSERYVLVIAGQPYGVDDTRASLVKPGNQVRLACKKDYEWGVPRAAHGWACRWNGGAR